MRQLSPNSAEHFLERLPDLMQVASVPGLVISVVSDGEPAATHAFGVKSMLTADQRSRVCTIHAACAGASTAAGRASR